MTAALPPLKMLKPTQASRHLLPGIAHESKDGAWTFLTWDLVDLYDFRVRLKAEFQGSNRDLYQESLILHSGECGATSASQSNRSGKSLPGMTCCLH